MQEAIEHLITAARGKAWYRLNYVTSQFFKRSRNMKNLNDKVKDWVKQGWLDWATAAAMIPTSKLKLLKSLIAK